MPGLGARKTRRPAAENRPAGPLPRPVHWTFVRKVKESETTNDLFGLLTTEPIAEVKAIPTARPRRSF
jgi:hypothetical protein